MQSDPAFERDSLAVVVLTFNEQANLARCLQSLGDWNERCLVVDSGSTDGTRRIAESFRVKWLHHPFQTHARQWAWALQNPAVSAEWVLGLDADQRLTSELKNEIAQTLSRRQPGDGGPVGYFIKRRQIFRGRWIRHGGYYPKYLLKLFQRERAWLDEAELVDHHFYVDGPVNRLNHDLIEDNRKEYDISVWIEKHSRYALQQAQEEFTRRTRRQPEGTFWSNPDLRVQRLKKVWERLPLFIRPALLFLYRYILRRGFLDGREGFIFHILQSFWYRLMVDIHLFDLRQGSRSAMSTHPSEASCEDPANLVHHRD